MKKKNSMIAGALLSMAFSAGAAVSEKPNIILIVTDDMDFDEFGFYSNRNGLRVLTPRMDQLARDGMVFERAYVTSTVCVPSRYSIMTGKYVGINPYISETVSHDKPVSYENRNQWGMTGAYIEAGGGDKTVAHYLKDLGYKTALFGKYHNDLHSMGWPYFHFGENPDDPEVAGKVREHYEATRLRVQQQTGFDVVDRLYWENKEALPVEALQFDNTPWITEGAVEFIRDHVETNPDQPFMMYYASPLPHGVAVSKWYDDHDMYPMKVNMEDRDARATLVGMLDSIPDIQPSREDVLERVTKAGLTKNTAVMTWLDDSIGAILDTLKQTGLEDNTVVMLISDHGSQGKRTLYDMGGCHIPFLVKWPGVIAPGSINSQLVGSIDLVPTCIALAGGDPAMNGQLSGVSLLPTFRDTSAEVRSDLLLQVGFARGIVTKDWKYIALRFPEYAETMQQNDKVIWDGSMRPGRKWFEGHYPNFTDDDQLYNLQKDPDERVNLAGNPEYKATTAGLQKRMGEYLGAMPHRFGEFNPTGK